MKTTVNSVKFNALFRDMCEYMVGATISERNDAERAFEEFYESHEDFVREFWTANEILTTEYNSITGESRVIDDLLDPTYDTERRAFIAALSAYLNGENHAEQIAERIVTGVCSVTVEYHDLTGYYIVRAENGEVSVEQWFKDREKALAALNGDELIRYF